MDDKKMEEKAAGKRQRLGSRYLNYENMHTFDSSEDEEWISGFRDAEPSKKEAAKGSISCEVNPFAKIVSMGSSVVGETLNLSKRNYSARQGVMLAEALQKKFNSSKGRETTEIIKKLDLSMNRLKYSVKHILLALASQEIPKGKAKEKVSPTSFSTSPFTTISLAFNDIDTRTFGDIGRIIPKLTHVRHLDFSGNLVSPGASQLFAISYGAASKIWPTELRSISFRCCRMRDASALQICAMLLGGGKPAHLEEIDMSGNAISPRAVAEILRMCKGINLKRIKMEQQFESWHRSDLDTILSPLASLTGLKHLEVSYEGNYFSSGFSMDQALIDFLKHQYRLVRMEVMLALSAEHRRFPLTFGGKCRRTKPMLPKVATNIVLEYLDPGRDPSAVSRNFSQSKITVVNGTERQEIGYVQAGPIKILLSGFVMEENHFVGPRYIEGPFFHRTLRGTYLSGNGRWISNTI